MGPLRAASEGDELPLVEVLPNAEMVIRYCGLSWSFPSLFYDVDAARAQGMPGTIVPGPVKLGLLSQVVEQWLEGDGWVRGVRAANRRPDVVGRPLTVTGRVVSHRDSDSIEQADIELTVTNESGQTTVRGFATVEFNSDRPR
ncbi:MAG TPA: hypothetical protein QGF35_06855 [Dehalococcoidia bacterium]|nr:hypothetical protein [Dehalococcoidia bacterium]